MLTNTNFSNGTKIVKKTQYGQKIQITSTMTFYTDILCWCKKTSGRGWGWWFASTILKLELWVGIKAVPMTSIVWKQLKLSKIFCLTSTVIDHDDWNYNQVSHVTTRLHKKSDEHNWKLLVVAMVCVFLWPLRATVLKRNKTSVELLKCSYAHFSRAGMRLRNEERPRLSTTLSPARRSQEAGLPFRH